MLDVDSLPVVVVGGGAAGFMAAITAAEAGVEGVEIWEATAEPLAKVRISGGGRCNVTHACWDPSELVAHYPRGQRPLRGPFSRFAAGDAVAWFAERGVELVEENDGRMFPVTNSSATVVAALRAAAHRAGVKLQSQRALQEVTPSTDGFLLQARGMSEPIRCRRLLLATGGHPSGRRIAAALGHQVVPPVPSLFTLRLDAPWLTALAGLSQAPVDLELQVGSERFRQRESTVLITHWGLSGPGLLRLTAFAARTLQQHSYKAELRINWCGGLDTEQLQVQFAVARQELARRQLGNGRPELLLPMRRRLWLALLKQAGLDVNRTWAELPRRGEQRLAGLLLRTELPVIGRGPFGEEFVTAGGVDLGEVNMATMESRYVSGLHFAGELVDVDGVTGGFNFQHCWSSGWIAGGAIASALACKR